MDVNELRTVLLVACFVIFLGIVWWAYSKKNTERHAEAANLPFADEQEASGSDGVNNMNRENVRV